MSYKRIRGNEITGDLDIFIGYGTQEEDEPFREPDEILIHGTPEGLRSLAALLLQIADLDQNAVADRHLPVGEREHYHLRPGIELAESSVEVIVGRLDAKGTGAPYDRFVPKAPASPKKKKS